jgi:hypothetical protein
LGDLGIDGRIILKHILKKYIANVLTGFICLVKGGEFNKPSEYLRFKKDSAPWSDPPVDDSFSHVYEYAVSV